MPKKSDIVGYDEQLIREVQDQFTLTRTAAKLAIALARFPAGQHGRRRQACKDAGIRTKNPDSYVSRMLTMHPACREAIKHLEEQFRRGDFARNMDRLGDQWALDRQRILADLELLKEQGLKEGQIGPAVRATELQGRAIGVNFSEHHIVQDQDAAAVIEAFATILGRDGADSLAKAMGAEPLVLEHEGPEDFLVQED